MCHRGSFTASCFSTNPEKYNGENPGLQGMAGDDRNHAGSVYMRFFYLFHSWNGSIKKRKKTR